jgi:hypothetical protein
MFNWDDYRTLAKNLAASDDDASLRSSISRSYYAAFHAAEDFCHVFNIPIPLEVTRRDKKDRSEHLRVIDALKGHPHSRVLHAGLLLDSMRTWRNSADYEMKFNGDVKAIAHEAIVRGDSLRYDFDNFFRAN